MKVKNPELSRPTNSHWLVFIGSSLLLTLFLFYIDEGYYSFAWARQPGAWFVLMVYLAAMLSGQLLFYKVLLKNYGGSSRLWISATAGALLGSALLIMFLYWKMQV